MAGTEGATVLLSQDWTVGVHVNALQVVPDEDWVRVTQAQFAPDEILRAARNLWS